MRLKRFLRSLVSGYAVMVANVIYTLTSVPLAFHYLNRKEFGLWLLAAQLAGYLALIDLGMSGVSRILIDHKDTKENGRYGSAFKTTLYVSLVQGLIITAVGFLLSVCIGPLLDVPTEFESAFATLTFAHALLLAASFMTRIFSYALIAHQRYDVGNYTQMISFAISLAVLWLAFRNGAGIYSIIWSQAAGWIVPATVSLVACWRLGLLPRRGEGGQANWTSFVEIFKFGRDIFLLMVGHQLVSASQTVIVTRLLGLEALALWSICTRIVTFMSQFVFRIFDYSSAALAEMFVRQEARRLHDRFRDLVALSCSAAVLLGAVLVVCNQPFVTLWTGGKFGWPRTNDVMLAAGLLVAVCSRAHIGLLGQTKLVQAARYIYLAEGTVFILVSFAIVPFAGIAGMIAASLFCNILFSASYGTWRTSRQLGVPLLEVVIEWMQRPIKLAVRIFPLALLLVFLLRSWSPTAQLVVGGAIICAVGGFWLLRVGTPDGIKREIATHFPGRWARIAGVSS